MFCNRREPRGGKISVGLFGHLLQRKRKLDRNLRECRILLVVSFALANSFQATFCPVNLMCDTNIKLIKSNSWLEHTEVVKITFF